jgi:hypothetical protein
MSRHAIDTSPFKKGETLFWREGLPYDRQVTFLRYEDEDRRYAVVSLFNELRRVPTEALRRPMPVW